MPLKTGCVVKFLKQLWVLPWRRNTFLQLRNPHLVTSLHSILKGNTNTRLRCWLWTRRSAKPMIGRTARSSSVRTVMTWCLSGGRNESVSSRWPFYMRYVLLLRCPFSCYMYRIQENPSLFDISWLPEVKNSGCVDDHFLVPGCPWSLSWK